MIGTHKKMNHPFRPNFDGVIDEVRFLNTDLSPEWIKMEYENQKNSDTFFEIGSEEEKSR